MNAPSLIYALRWLTRDTFRQAVAGKVFWLMLGVSALAVVFCLGVGVEGGSVRDEGELYSPDGKLVMPNSGPPGTLSLFYGAMTVEMARDRASAVELIYLMLASWVAGAVGLLLTLIWTASFIPEFLQPTSATVLLAKPLPRWVFLAGKYLGVVLFVGFQATIFFVGTWLALGSKTGIWVNAYLAGIVLLTLQFAVFYGFSVLVAVSWRSSVACVLGVILLWASSFGINYGRFAAMAMPQIGSHARQMSPTTKWLIDAAYWMMPKPADMVITLQDLLSADKHSATFRNAPVVKDALARGAYDPLLSLISSLGFGIVMLGLAGAQLAKVEY
ncbi:MAG: hypothetical protein U0744_13745 [Gemmataceae bacterium]